MRFRASISGVLRGVTAAIALALLLQGTAHAQWAWDADVGWINLKEKAADTELGQYAAAKALFIQGHSAAALDAFSDFERRFPNSAFRAKSALNRARCLANLGRVSDAVDVASALAALEEKDEAARVDAATLAVALIPRLDRERTDQAIRALTYVDDSILPSGLQFAARMEMSRRRLQMRQYEAARQAASGALEVAPAASRLDARIAAALAELAECRDTGHDPARVSRAMELLRDRKDAPLESVDVAREYLDVAQSLLEERRPTWRAVYYATTYVYEKDYDTAAPIFKTAAKEFAGTPVGETAAFYRGEVAFGQRDWSDAFELYEKCAKSYPATRRMSVLVQREFDLARALDREGETEQAVQVMEAVTFNKPDGVLADDAYMFAGQAQLARGKYADAESSFNTVVTAYPNSEWRSAALFYSAKADLQLSAIARDNEQLLQKARDSFVLYLREEGSRGQFSEEAKALLAECKEKQAAALMEIAAMYARRSEPRAAMAYYERVLNHYAESKSAEAARKATVSLQERGIKLPWNESAKTGE